jgi:hypothetical protein
MKRKSRLGRDGFFFSMIFGQYPVAGQPMAATSAF